MLATLVPRYGPTATHAYLIPTRAGNELPAGCSFSSRYRTALAEHAQGEYERRLLPELNKRVSSELGRYELDLIALSYVHQLGHDSQYRIFKFFAWEGAKTKVVNGGYTDYPKLASAKLDKMTTAEIGKFLVVYALATELFCPTHYAASFSKVSKLTVASNSATASSKSFPASSRTRGVAAMRPNISISFHICKLRSHTRDCQSCRQSHPEKQCCPFRR